MHVFSRVLSAIAEYFVYYLHFSHRKLNLQYSNCTVYWYYFYVANCTSTWVELGNKPAVYNRTASIYVSSASTLKRCQEVCEFDHRCVAIDWQVDRGQSHCWIITNPNHEHHDDATHSRYTHYELVSRCYISTGVLCPQ